jgi:hypothetical protein
MMIETFPQSQNLSEIVKNTMEVRKIAKPYCTVNGKIEGLVFSNLSVDQVKSDLAKEEERIQNQRKKNARDAQNSLSLVVRETSSKFSDLWKRQVRHHKLKKENLVMT